MSESLVKAGWESVCTNLWAIRRSRSWQQLASSWDVYAKRYWSLSKSRAGLMVKFAKLCALCREEYQPVPDSPDNVAPILALPEKKWTAAWQVCRDMARNEPINAEHCESTLQHFGMNARKRVPEKVLKARRFQKATKDIASVQDGEALVEDIGVRGLGKYHDDAVRVLIDSDQAARNVRSGR